MMTLRNNRILRFEVPVDDRWHEVPAASPPLHVACRKLDVVEFWAFGVTEDIRSQKYRVFGTGHPLDDAVNYVGTALAPGGGLVWHLMAKW